MVPEIVTIAVAVLIFPFTSITFNVTVLSPILLQLNEEGLTLIEAIPQLSRLPLLISLAVIEAVPAERLLVIF